MSTDTLLRSTLHPPCPVEQEILEIVVPADRHQLAVADRLSLRLGLWLLLRAQRSRRRAPAVVTHEEATRLRDNQDRLAREAAAVLVYQLQRFPR